MGYQVTTKTSSTEALELFRSKPDEFDLVITDQTMPDLTGAELSQELLKIRPDIPIILCSGYSSKVSMESLGELGIREFITKPLISGQLGAAIRRVLDGEI
jgi:CheY-like chemotaxis protein